MLIGIPSVILIGHLLKSANEKVDEKIRALCAEFSDASVTLTYQTQYTGLCKPKHTQTGRWLFISPGGASGTAVAAPGSMMVTCPAGCKPGDAVQIQTPAGAMRVVIPPGVSEGGTLQVQTAAPPVVQAVAVPPV